MNPALQQTEVYLETTTPEGAELDLQFLRGASSAGNTSRARRFWAAAAAFVVFGVLGYVAGGSDPAPTLGLWAIGVVIAILLIVTGVTVATARDGERAMTASELLRSLDLAPQTPVSVGLDVQVIKDADTFARAPSEARLRELAALPPAFAPGRVWLVARGMLADGTAIVVTRSIRQRATHRTDNRGTTTTTYHYMGFDAVSVTFDPRRNDALTRAGASVQQRLIVPHGFVGTAFHAAPGQLAVAWSSDWIRETIPTSVGTVLHMASQLLALVGGSRAVVAPSPVRPADEAAFRAGGGAIQKAAGGGKLAAQIAGAFVLLGGVACLWGSQFFFSSADRSDERAATLRKDLRDLPALAAREKWPADRIEAQRFDDKRELGWAEDMADEERLYGILEIVGGVVLLAGGATVIALARRKPKGA